MLHFVTIECEGFIMSKDNIIFRVPKDLIPMWNQIKRKVAREHPEMLTEDGELKDSTVLKAMMMDYSRRDLYVISTSIEKIFPKLNQISNQINNVDSNITRLKLKIK